MTQPSWQLSIPIDAVIFDCDGTLSHIEGIDELAKMNGVGTEVENLTALAMGQSGINSALYQQRLDLVKPSREQVEQIGNAYIAQKTPDVSAVIRILQQLGKTVYIVSAGLLPAVTFFGKHLDIKETDIFAVDVYFNKMGEYKDFDRHSSLVTPNGKCTIVENLKQKHPRIVHVGDGLNDLATRDMVTRFIGYGGAYYRENMEQLSHFYVRSPSLAPLLALCLTGEEITQLSPDDHKIYAAGIAHLKNDTLLKKIKAPFSEAVKT